MADLQKLPARGSHRRNLAHVGPVREFLVLALGGDDYGVELTSIREILNPPPITPVPRANKAILGVCSVRGLLVTVLDLRRRLDLEPNSAPKRRRLLLTNGARDEVFGIIVDEVRQVVRLTESELELSSAVLGDDVADHVLGIGRPQSAQNVIILLDLSRVVALSPEEK